MGMFMTCPYRPLMSNDPVALCAGVLESDLCLSRLSHEFDTTKLLLLAKIVL